MFNKLHIKNTAPIIILVLFFILSLGMSWYQGLFSEDTIHTGAQSFREALEIASQSYNLTNSRIGEMAMYFCFMSEDGAGGHQMIWVYRLLNPCMVTLCALLVYRLGVGCWPNHTKKSLITLCIIILCMLCNKTGFYWLDGNMSWFYPIIAAMGFFILIEPMFYGNFHLSKSRLLAALLLTPIIGMSNENTSAVSFLLVVFVGILHMVRCKRIKFEAQHIIITLPLLAFVLLFYLAPGPYNRIGQGGSINTSMFMVALNGLFSAHWFHVFFWCWRIIFIAILITFFFPSLFKKLTKRSLILIAAVTALGGILLTAPNFGAPRSLIPVEVIIYTIIANIIYNTNFETTAKKIKLSLLLSLQLLLSLTILIPHAVRTIDSAKIFRYVEQRAAQARAEGNSQLVLHVDELRIPSIWQIKLDIPRSIMEIYPIYTGNIPLLSIPKNKAKTSCFQHVYGAFPYKNSSPDYALNKGVARYFGLESIILIRNHQHMLPEDHWCAYAVSTQNKGQH